MEKKHRCEKDDSTILCGRAGWVTVSWKHKVLTVRKRLVPSQSHPGQKLALRTLLKPRTLKSHTKERVPISVTPSEPSPDSP